MKNPRISRLLVGLVLPLLAACPMASNLRAAQAPGKAGVYCKFGDLGKNPEALAGTMRQIKGAGIDFILPYAKLTSGKVNWASRVAAPELIENAAFMDAVVKEAHAAGLKVHPVFCVATEGGDTTPNRLLERHPDWAFVQEGKRVGYIDPGQPAARKYEIELILELIKQHPVDGLSLDYMRAPNRVGYTETGRAAFLSTHKVDLAKIASGQGAAQDTEGGKKAAASAAAARKHPLWPEWQTWKREQLNGFMREIRAAVNEARPGLPISSYCWGAQTYGGSFETAQDWKTWIQAGWLDWINPSGYRYTDDEFTKAAAVNRASVPRDFPCYITIGVSTSHGKLPDAAAVKKQMDLARDAGADGLVFFTWEALSKFLPEAGEAIKIWQPAAKARGNPAPRPAR